MAKREAAQLDFTEGALPRVNALSKIAPQSTSSRSAHWKFWWMAAIALQALCGFFVAKIPVRPELAHISVAFVIIFAWPCYRAMVRWLGVREGVRLLIALGVFALALESFAIVTGFPYGRFVYGDKIGARLFGIVPWTVPFAWTPLVCMAIALGRRVTGQVAPLILWGGAVLVAIDFVLDPGAVAQGFWRYEGASAPGAMYGVPLQNFAGWMLTGSLATGLCLYLVPRLCHEIPPAELLGSSLLILSFWSSVCLWMNLWLPGMVGILLLGISTCVFFGENHDCDGKYRR